MERAERIKRDYLIAELLGINTEQDYAEIQRQIHDQITNDWQSFETRYNESLKLIVGDTTNFDAENVSSWIDAVNNFNEVVNNYNGVFDSFFEQYKENILELDSLQKQAQEILNREWEVSKNDKTGNGIMDIYDDITTGSNDTGIFGSGGTVVDGVLMSNADAQMINALRAEYAKKQKEYNNLRDTQGKEAADAKYQTQFQNLHNSAEAIRKKYGYSGSYNGNAQEIIDWDTYNKYKQLADQIYAETTGKAWQNGQDFSTIYGDTLGTLNDYTKGLSKGYANIGSTNKDYLNSQAKFITTSMGQYKTIDGQHYYAVNSLGQFNSNVASQYQMLQMTTQGHLVDQDGNIVAEMQDYNQLNQINVSTVASWAALNADSKVQMDYYTLTFEQFLSKYESQIREFARLQQEQVSVSGGTIGGGSGSGSGGSGGSNNDITGGWTNPGDYSTAGDSRYDNMSASDRAKVEEYTNYYNAWKEKYFEAKAKGDQAGMAEAQAGMKRAHDKVESIRNKYGWTGGTTGGGYTPLSSGSGSGSGSGTGGNRGGTGTTSLAQRRSRANGILGGPVTETAEYMLHGSPSEPEYVLNNDQAWRLLTNITTLEMDKELPNTSYKSKEEKTRQKDKEGNVGKTVNYYDYSTLNYNDSSIDNSIGGNNQPITITDPTYTYPGGLDYANPDSVLDIYGGSKYPSGGSNIGTGTNTGVKDEITIDDDGLKSYNWGSGNGVRETKSGLLEYENPEENDKYLQSILDSSKDGTNIIPDGKGGYYVIYSPNYELVNGLTTKIRDGVDLDNLDPELLSQLSYKHILSASSNNPVSDMGLMDNPFIQADQKNPRFWLQESGSWDVAGQKIFAGSLGLEGLRVNQALGLSGNRVSLDTLDKNSPLMDSAYSSHLSNDEKEAWKLILGDSFGSRINSPDLALKKLPDGSYGPTSELWNSASGNALNAVDIAAKRGASKAEQQKIYDAMLLLAEAQHFGETDKYNQILSQLEATANKYGYSVGSNGLGNTTKITSAVSDYINSSQYQAKKQYEQELGSTIETLIDNSAKQRTDSVKYALEYGLLTEGGLEQYQKHMTGEYTGRLISGGKTYDWKDFDINSSDLITTEDIAAYAIAKDLGRELASWNLDTFLKRNIDGIKEFKKQTEQFEKTAQANSKVEQTINDNDKKIYEGRYQNSVDSLNKMANSYSRQEALNDSHLSSEQIDVLYSGKNAQQQDTINKQLVSAWSMFNTDSKAQQLLASGNMSQFIQEYGASVAQFGEDAKKMSDTHNNILDSLTNFQQGASKFNEAVGSMIQTGNQTIIDGINNANKLTNDYYETIRNSYNYGGYTSGSSSSDDYYRDKYLSNREDEGYQSTGQGSNYANNQAGMSQADRDKISQAQKDYQIAAGKGDTAGMNAAHNAAEAIRDKYEFSGGADGSEYNKKSNSGSGSGSGGSKTNSGTGSKTGGATYITGPHGGKIKVSSGGTKVQKKRSNGILGGPVDTTEPYMLHGTKNNPEYVLNSKQAYTLLRNISTMNYSNGTSKLTEDDKKIILQAQKDYQNAIANKDKNAMELAHSVAETIRSKYSYSGGISSKNSSVNQYEYFQSSSTQLEKAKVHTINTTLNKAQEMYKEGAKNGNRTQMEEAHAIAERARNQAQYSGLLQIQTGRLEKAVNGISEIYSKSSSTSQSSVEQRLLLNLKSTKTPEYKSLVEKQGNETKYVLNGDVVIDGTSDPKEFWSNVSSAMQNRSNVTKNIIR